MAHQQPQRTPITPVDGPAAAAPSVGGAAAASAAGGAASGLLVPQGEDVQVQMRITPSRSGMRSGLHVVVELDQASLDALNSGPTSRRMTTTTAPVLPSDSADAATTADAAGDRTTAATTTSSTAATTAAATATSATSSSPTTKASSAAASHAHAHAHAPSHAHAHKAAAHAAPAAAAAAEAHNNNHRKRKPDDEVDTPAVKAGHTPSGRVKIVAPGNKSFASEGVTRPPMWPPPDRGDYIIKYPSGTTVKTRHRNAGEVSGTAAAEAAAAAAASAASKAASGSVFSRLNNGHASASHHAAAHSSHGHQAAHAHKKPAESAPQPAASPVKRAVRGRGTVGSVLPVDSVFDRLEDTEENHLEDDNDSAPKSVFQRLK
eukprot:m.126594 g.126594  ORF g.126594 m.126594 type:complete len:376 (-) comp16343_c0_seq3:242-1369(-)